MSPQTLPGFTETGYSSVPAPTQVAALDGVRGIAIIMVLSVHLWSIGLLSDRPYLHLVKMVMWSGWSGVDLFFVLSGFLITGILIDTRSAPNRVSAFYARRALRILPLYYLGVFGAIAAAHFSANRM